ncbi:15996_t:CDS:1, partial [Racocetra persica]
MKVQAVLQSLNIVLRHYSKSVSNFDLPELLLEFNIGDLSKMQLEELNYQITSEELDKANMLNDNQHKIFNE